MFGKLFDAYPAMFALTIVAPLVGGIGAAIIGSWLGYENLKRQFISSQQSQRLEKGLNDLISDNSALTSTLHLLESYNERLAVSGKRDEVLAALIIQYQQLTRSAALFAKMTHREISLDQEKIATQILKILNEDLVRVAVRDDLPNKPLVIELSPNSFRVINPVPMRRPPDLRFTGLPKGTSPVVSDKSEISFTVSFVPLSIPVKTFDVIASSDF